MTNNRKKVGFFVGLGAFVMAVGCLGFVSQRGFKSMLIAQTSDKTLTLNQANKPSQLTDSFSSFSNVDIAEYATFTYKNVKNSATGHCVIDNGGSLKKDEAAVWFLLLLYLVEPLKYLLVSTKMNWCMNTLFQAVSSSMSVVISSNLSPLVKSI